MGMGDDTIQGDPPDSGSKNGSVRDISDNPEKFDEYVKEITSQKNIQAGPVAKAQPNPSQTQTPAGDKPEEGCLSDCLKKKLKNFSPWLGERVNLKTGCKIIIVASVIWIACCILIPPDMAASLLSLIHLPIPFPVYWLWLLTMAVFVADGIAIGYYFKERWSGIFINERKCMSLSRVQVALWSLLILSAFFTILVVRFRSGAADPMNIGIDLQVWALMGISLGSLAGRTAIMGKKGVTMQDKAKVEKVVNENTIKTAAKQLKKNEDTVKKQIESSESVLYSHESDKDANLMDMFQGDEVVNKWVVDIGKVQTLFFTVITIAAYASAIWALLLHTAIGSITALPPMTDGFVAVLGVSHAGLLANSATIQTPTKQ
jgi:hypothetical protein